MDPDQSSAQRFQPTCVLCSMTAPPALEDGKWMSPMEPASTILSFKLRQEILKSSLDTQSSIFKLSLKSTQWALK